MNLLLLERDEIDGAGVARVAGRRAEHVARVLRATPGARLRAGILDGAVGHATVIATSTDALLLDARELVAAVAAPPGPVVDVILAVPRPKALARTVQTLAALGVRRVDLVNAWRVDASYFNSPRLALAALAEDARLGAEQGMVARVPAIAVHRLLVPFLAEILAPRLAVAAGADGAAPRCVLAHPRSEDALEAVVPPGDRRPVVLAIGPEGGWIDRELESFVAAGFVPVLLGTAVLRSENAVAAALAQLELLRRLPPPLSGMADKCDPPQA